MAAFDIKGMTRNRCVSWANRETIVAANAKGATITISAGEKEKGVYSSDLMDDKGVVNIEACKVLGLDPKSVTMITVNDLPADFANGPKAALTRLATEWTTDKIKWTPDDVAHYLALSARMQDEANESVKRHRPVTDRAAERAASTMTKILRAQGKSEAEISAALKAVGMAK